MHIYIYIYIYRVYSTPEIGLRGLCKINCVLKQYK